VFTLGDEEYGIDILKVQEIRGKMLCWCLYTGSALWQRLRPGASL